MINIDLWIISLHEIKTDYQPSDIDNKISSIINNNLKNQKIRFEWNVELFTLTKLRIKNGAYYLYKNIVLNSNDFENIIGCDYSDIYTNR